jgi:hypothetical protein
VADSDDKIEVENVNHPGTVSRVNAAKYSATREVMLNLLPESGSGVTQAEMVALVKPALPNALFPGGATAMWWVKTVQLDLEAKKLLKRINGKPLRWLRNDETASSQIT